MGKLFDKVSKQGKLNSPFGDKLQNPMKNGDIAKKLQKKQQEVLQKEMGMRLPKSPV